MNRLKQATNSHAVTNAICHHLDIITHQLEGHLYGERLTFIFQYQGQDGHAQTGYGA